MELGIRSDGGYEKKRLSLPGGQTQSGVVKNK